ncbi:MAG TPA: hypothetical protein VFE85_09765, partial [Woeseiaceae bacterium]|nr:hypothetical protein [Woeseiaceae bacterium]
MKTLHTLTIAACALLLVAGAASAQEDEGDLDGTIHLMGDADATLPDAVTREITLPASVDIDAKAAAASAEGLATANEARDSG